MTARKSLDCRAASPAQTNRYGEPSELGAALVSADRELVVKLSAIVSRSRVPWRIRLFLRREVYRQRGETTKWAQRAVFAQSSFLSLLSQSSRAPPKRGFLPSAILKP